MKKRWSSWGRRREEGTALIEALVSVAILGTAITVFLAALSSAAISVRIQEERAQTQRIAYSQLEQTRAEAFMPLPASYRTVPPPPGYAVTVVALPGPDANLQQIRVTISRGSRTLFSVDDYKVNR